MFRTIFSRRFYTTSGNQQTDINKHIWLSSLSTNILLGAIWLELGTINDTITTMLLVKNASIILESQKNGKNQDGTQQDD